MTFEMTVPVMIKTLHNLSTMIDKSAKYAESKKFEADVLLNSRLAPDQFNFLRQVQIACDTAKLGISRLTGKDAPVHDDSEKTLPEVKARLESVIGYLKKFTAEDFKEAATKKVTTPRWEAKYLTGDDYMAHHVIPNFYFHVTTAYAILRHNGVEIGKKDYLGELPFKQ